VSDGGRKEFVDVLTMGVEAWDRWQSDVDSDDYGKRTKSRMEQRGIESRLNDMLACNSVEVARMLVTMWRALEREELLHRSESLLDHLVSRLGGEI